MASQQWHNVPEDTIVLSGYGLWRPFGEVLIDSSGNILVGTTSADSIFDSFTFYNFSASGNLLWKIKEKPVYQLGGALTSFKIGSDGSIYAIGRTEIGPAGIWLIKLGDIQTDGGSVNSNFFVDIFPNPSAALINIYSGRDNITSYAIYTLEGKLLISNMKVNQKEITITTQNIESGLYLLKVETIDGYYSKEIEIMR